MPSSESPSRLRQRLTWIIAAAVLLVAVVAWRMSGRDAPAAQYQTAAVDRGDVVSRVSASGTLSATVTVDVGSQVSGRIQSLFADYNSVVKKGERVAKIDPSLFEAAVAQSQAALELAQIDLQNTQIIAPTGGQLGQISVRLGAYVSAGTHLTSLVPPQHWVIANLKETQLAEVRVGQPVTFTVDALNGETFHGKVQSISPATGVEFSAISPDNATGNFVKIAQRIPVRITVNDGQNNSERLRPGMSVQVTIDTRAEKQP